MYKSVNKWWYGPTPEERVREWQTKLRQESRQLDREILKLQSDLDKSKGDIRAAAKRGDLKSAKILATAVVNGNKQVSRLHTSKAQLGSIGSSLQNQLAILKITGSLQKSSEIMSSVNHLVSVPQISAPMRELSMEMTKAGILEEMMDDVLASQEDVDDEIEEAADMEVEKVLFDLTGGKLGKLENVETELPANQRQEVQDEDMERMKQRLDAMLGS